MISLFFWPVMEWSHYFSDMSSDDLIISPVQHLISVLLELFTVLILIAQDINVFSRVSDMKLDIIIFFIHWLIFTSCSQSVRTLLQDTVTPEVWLNHIGYLARTVTRRTILRENKYLGLFHSTDRDKQAHIAQISDHHIYLRILSC